LIVLTLFGFCQETYAVEEYILNDDYKYQISSTEEVTFWEERQ
jgi:hypothetical protein